MQQFVHGGLKITDMSWIVEPLVHHPNTSLIADHKLEAGASTKSTSSSDRKSGQTHIIIDFYNFGWKKRTDQNP
jgi:hypothetical protein